MKTILIAVCLSFFSLGLFADDTAVATGTATDPIAPVAEPDITASAAPAEQKAAPAKREVARKRKHAKAKKHRRHHRRK